MRLMFSLPGAFGGYRDFQAVARHQAGVHDGRRIVLGVDPAEGVGHHRAPQSRLQIASTHAFMDSLLQIALNMDLLAHIEKNTGDAGVPDKWAAAPPLQFHNFPQFGPECPGPAPRAPAPGSGDDGPHILRQIPVGAHTQPGHGLGNGFPFDLPHGYVPFHCSYFQAVLPPGIR